MTTEIILSLAPELQPASLFTPTPKAAQRVLEFFTAQFNNGGPSPAHHQGHNFFPQAAFSGGFCCTGSCAGAAASSAPKYFSFAHRSCALFASIRD